MSEAKSTELVLGGVPSMCTPLIVDTASKVGPDSYVIAAPTAASLSTKAAPWTANVESRTNSPPPVEAESDVVTHVVIVVVVREWSPDRREIPPPPAPAWPAAVQRATVAEVNSTRGRDCR